jgi:hypothetical protein
MILVWNDAKSFQRHLEDMQVFRRSHQAGPSSLLQLLRDMPTFDDIDSFGKSGTIKSFTSASGKLILVPIWKITIPRGSQN